jgi:ABC-type oligopeptide transport system substrate-binding subunit
VQFFALNTDTGPLRDPTLRRAIGYAIDRPALAAVTGAFPDDRYLPVGMPARSTQHVYPVDGPNVARARALLRGRHPALTLYTCDRPDCVQRARILTANLKAVGITLHVRRFEDQYHAAPGFDLRDSTWFVDEFDPVNILGVPMFGQKLYFDVPTGFTDPTWKRRVRAADRLATTNGRFEAFGELERGLMRGPSPWAAFADPAERMFLSADVGCVTMNPVYGLDYAALCVRDHPS